jgi:hypothetical protein
VKEGDRRLEIEETRSRGWGDKTVGLEDGGKWAMSQVRQAAFGSWKQQENGCSLAAPRRNETSDPGPELFCVCRFRV